MTGPETEVYELGLKRALNLSAITGPLRAAKRLITADVRFRDFDATVNCHREAYMHRPAACLSSAVGWLPRLFRVYATYSTATRTEFSQKETSMYI